jgi:hypothetical protein
VSLRSKVCEIIHSTPGVTELEIARRIYGSGVDQGQVNRMCRQLVDEGCVVRAGKGGPHNPFTYSWAGKLPKLGDARPLSGPQQLSI